MIGFIFDLPPTLSDYELWCWKGQFLCNKANGYVLDIRKGRLRLIEDTEICLYHAKPLEEAHNQLWSVREDPVDVYGRPLPGVYIYSLYSNEWVLEIQQSSSEKYQKLVLFPLQPIDNENQRWLFVPEGQLDLNIPIQDILSLTTRKNSSSSIHECILTPPASLSPSSSYPTPTSEYEYPQGLSPAKRGSHPSIFSMDTFKEYHQRIYTLQKQQNISDKGIAMAAAYHIFQNWKLDQLDHDLISDFPLLTSPFEIRSRFQTLVQKEVHKLLSNSNTNHLENTSSLSTRFIIQLYDQTPISP
ncbi:uncharacterized protein BX663DRAFT_24982 [Cokeromyces recurvatus]|uniref:uncharacterized protein n=1 Tax=Cokeromyces recurvatus TaxID=90255 RepID=UPI00221FC49E|nr:uncharacterized protein BX663DRAFT_24982 [Cokeromyces recurvatus]KAI7908216.1 hypothetical protein BX663DRAFT_24982 [Cokeromyces recurvatus]